MPGADMSRGFRTHIMAKLRRFAQDFRTHTITRLCTLAQYGQY